MLKLMTTLIALTAIGVVVKARSEKKITKGTLSAESAELINNDSEKKTLREWRKDPRYKKPEATAQNIKINLDPLIRAEKELEKLLPKISAKGEEAKDSSEKALSEIESTFERADFINLSTSISIEPGKLILNAPTINFDGDVFTPNR